MLWYDQPAASWEKQALPIATGRLGGMLFGAPAVEEIQLNEHSLWGGINDYDNALAGQPDWAFDTSVTGFGCYLDTGRVRVEIGGASGAADLSAVSDYRRSLDLRTGVHRVVYTLPGATDAKGRPAVVTREAIAHRDTDVILLHLHSTAVGGLDAAITLESAQDAPTDADADGRTLRASGTLTNGLRHLVAVRVGRTDGAVTAVPGDATTTAALRVAGATEVTLVIDAGTDYALSAADDWRGPDPAPAVEARLASAARREWEALRADHERAMQALTGSVLLDLGSAGAEVEDLPTDARLRRYATGVSDPGLERLVVEYGWYLLLSSSRPGVCRRTCRGCGTHRISRRGPRTITRTSICR
ncbi:glycoside hydrolase family 95 protein [Brachybacterium sp. EF45031]|nr:glycoside hydrolase family 95 protein [Brachybacterium sillae]MCS6711928.1 glycoside hydrolase family 95 protein [Brachybacterium sillae]